MVQKKMLGGRLGSSHPTRPNGHFFFFVSFLYPSGNSLACVYAEAYDAITPNQSAG